MAIDFRKELNARYEMLSKSIVEIENKIVELPEGRINVKHQKDKAYYYFDGTKTKCIFRGGGAACPAWREPRVRTRRSHPFELVGFRGF